MANPEHLEILKQGVEAWNQWREQNPQTKPDLSGAILREANLRGADLGGATGLTQDQIDKASINEETILPKDLK